MDEGDTSEGRSGLNGAINYLDRTGSQPTMTRVAARGERKGTSCRSSGGAHNALKSAGGLWHALFQWFVNELVQIQARSDASMLLHKAREMKNKGLER